MATEKEESVREPSTALQIVYGLIAYSAIMAPSMSIGFSAVALPPLQSPNNPNHLSPTQASWFASIASIATPVGCFLFGPISDRFGRKAALVVVNIVTFLGWIVLALAYDFQDHLYGLLIFGRLLTGLSTGLSSMPAAVYMAEISTPKLRGMFTTASAIFFSFGILAVYVLGWICGENWGRISTITAVFPCCSMLFIILMMPESPPWLVSKDRIDEATASMSKIYGLDSNNRRIQDDIDALIRNRDVSKATNKTPQKSSSIWTSLQKKMAHLRRPTCMKPLLIIGGYFFFQQFTGTFVVVFYAIEIVKSAGVKIDPYLAIVLIALTRFVCAILVSYISKIYGRRPLTMVSGIGMTISLLVLTAYLYLRTTDDYSWIPMLSLLVYYFTTTLGFITLPFAMAAECFPAKVRGLATGLTTCMAYIFNFITVKIFPSMLQTLDSHGVFLFYCAMSLVGTVFLYFYLPETKGKTLMEIEEQFGKKRKPIVKSEEGKKMLEDA